MIHPATELRWVSPTVGYGVFATSAIPLGTITYVRDALEVELPQDRYDQLPPLLQEYAERFSYIDEEGVRVLSWDLGKHVNHCCQCNTMSTGYGFEIAIRDIAAGEEITDEYGLFNLGYELPLSCSRGPCRGCVSSRDLATHADEWDRKVQAALVNWDAVEQPLLPLVDASVQRELQALRSGSAVRSVRQLAYAGSRTPRGA